MKIRRRRFLHLAAGTVVLPVVSRMARAQTYPTRPVRLIVGVTAGGRNDPQCDGKSSMAFECTSYSVTQRQLT
jgi:hypothetical protein